MAQQLEERKNLPGLTRMFNEDYTSDNADYNSDEGSDDSTRRRDAAGHSALMVIPRAWITKKVSINQRHL